MTKKIFILLCLLSSWFASAYNFTIDFNQGLYWQTLPVVFKIQDSNELLNELASASNTMWSDAANLSLWGIDNNSKTSNVIRWSKNFGAETGYDEKSTLAITVRTPSGPYWSKFEIILNGSTYITQDANALRTVIVHEMGHTLGLDHSTDPDAVMGAYINLNFQDLAQDDVDGINSLVTETKKRQESNYKSPISSQSSSKGLSCGTVDLGNDHHDGPKAGNVIGSLLIGFLMAMAMRKNLKFVSV